VKLNKLKNKTEHHAYFHFCVLKANPPYVTHSRVQIFYLMRQPEALSTLSNLPPCLAQEGACKGSVPDMRLLGGVRKQPLTWLNAEGQEAHFSSVSNSWWVDACNGAMPVAGCLHRVLPYCLWTAQQFAAEELRYFPSEACWQKLAELLPTYKCLLQLTLPPIQSRWSPAKIHMHYPVLTCK